MELIVIITAVVLLVLLSFANGANDVSKSIATLAGAGVTSIDKAVLWGVAFTILGALSGILWGGAIVKNLSHAFYDESTQFNMYIALSIAIAPIIWVFLSTYAKLPVSTTHSLVGAFLGTGIVAFGMDHILWSKIAVKIILPLLVSPIASILLAIFAYKYIKSLTQRLPDNEYKLFGFRFKLNEDSLHWLTSGTLSFARGLNDTPKLIAVILPVLVIKPADIGSVYYIIAALSMGAGAFIIGSRITKVLACNVTTMNHSQGFSANLIASFLVIGASKFGLPVSTTHVATSAIIGIGVAGKTKIDLKVVYSMLGAWIVTVPGAALIAAACYYLFSIFG